MTPGFGQDLLKRRVPQILGIYLAVGWGVLEFVDWLISRYDVTPRLADVSLVAWVAMIPTVLLLAYHHGARGPQRWRRVERVGVPVNAIVTLALIAIVLSRGGLRSGALAIDAAALDPTRIAVLYFDDESEDQSLGHLANTFTGALIDELSQVSGLDVVPRGGVKPYRDASVSLDSLVRALGMGTLVEGSVTGSRESLALNVALIDPGSQSTIESFALRGPVAEWQDLRNDLAAQVARRLRQRLGVEVQLRERRAGTSSPEALAAVEQAEALRDESDVLEAAGDSAAAVRALVAADSVLAAAEGLDPSWVEPIVLRGWVARDQAALLGAAADDFDKDLVIRGLAHAERALERAPEDARALELHGVLLFQMSVAREASDPSELRERAERELRAAVAADPWRARAWSDLSELQRRNTQFAEARQSAERALEADPFLEQARVIIFRQFQISLDLKDVSESIRWCDEGRRRFPADEWFVSCSLFLLGLSEGPEPDVDRAWVLLDSIWQMNPPQSREQRQALGETWVAGALARAGLRDSADAVIERVRAAPPEAVAPWIDYYAANVRLLLGERDRALDMLHEFLQAIPQRKEYIASDWMFQDLWDDPRFKELVGSEE
jgi:TolB-like protein